MLHDHYAKNKNIQIIGAPKNVGQFQHVASILNEFKDYHNTALVLADETLLPLAINHIPQKAKKLPASGVNITMGYPLKFTPLSSFFDLLFDLYLNNLKFNASGSQNFYHLDVINLLEHPFFGKMLSTEEAKMLFKINEFIQTNNLIFIYPNKLKNSLDETCQEIWGKIMFLFQPLQTISAFIDRALQLCQLWKIALTDQESELFSLEYVYRFYRVFKQLENLNNQYIHISKLKAFQQIYRQVCTNEKLDFQGEPLEGLQVMGVLETRVLDFENLIITSVNEEILPAGKGGQSFIPFDLKNHFRLPTYQQKDAMFSLSFLPIITKS